MRTDITIRSETKSDYKAIISLVLRSFSEGTDYSDGTDVIALIEEIRESEFYVPSLSFVAELDAKIVGHFMFSRFPISRTKDGGHGGAADTDILMLGPVAVDADHLRQKIGSTMLTLGIAEAKIFGCAGIMVEGNYRFYNTLGFSTSTDFGIIATEGFPLTEPRCMMCMESHPGSLAGHGGYVVYDMYKNA